MGSLHDLDEYRHGAARRARAARTEKVLDEALSRLDERLIADKAKAERSAKNSNWFFAILMMCIAMAISVGLGFLRE